jgi:phage/plasmid primase-like uncharacterized protein
MMLHGLPQHAGPLCIAEGLETAVGAIMGGINEGAPVWALSGTSFMAELGPIMGVNRLIIACDNDKPGRAAAYKCARLWKERAAVDIVWPDKKGADWADVCRRA